MINNILICRETRKVSSKDSRFIGMEGENLQEALIFNLDEQIEGNAIIEILFPDESTAYIEIEKTERGYELPVKSSLLTQNGIIKMQLRIIQAGQEIFKSELIRFKVKESINATTTIPEEYPTWIDNLEVLKLNLENAEKERVKAEEGRIDAEKARVETFNQMGQAVDNAIGNIVDLQEAYDKNAQDKIKEFNSNVVTQTENIDKHVQDKITEYDEHTEELTNRLDGIDEKDIDQDKLIEDLQNQIIDLETENENIKNQFPTGQAEGENITLNDSANMEFKELRIGGNSWQETREGYNLLDKELLISTIPSNWEVEQIQNGVKVTRKSSYTSGLSLRFGLKPNTKYTIYGRTGEKTSSHATLSFSRDGEYYTIINLSSENLKVLETSSTGDLVLNFSLDVGTYAEFLDLMLLEGEYTADTIPPYEQFGAMPSPEFESPIENITGSAKITVCNENLFNYKDYTYDNTIFNAYRFVEIKGLKPNTTYTFSNYDLDKYSQKSSGAIYISRLPNYNQGVVGPGTRGIYNRDKGVFNRTVEFTTSETGKCYLGLYINTWTQTLWESLIECFSNATFLEGKGRTAYIPHQSQQFTFPLSEGQRMYKDSYLADDGVHHKRGQYQFTGGETLLTDLELTNTKRYYNNLKVVNAKSILAVSNRFAQADSAIDLNNNDNEKILTLNGGQFAFRLNKTTADGVTAVKNWLAEQYANGTPVIVEYELANEVIEPYTEEQQLVYNEIKKAHSYKNVTHIFSTDEIKPINKVIYRKDWETINQKQEDRILALENAVLGGN